MQDDDQVDFEALQRECHGGVLRELCREKLHRLGLKALAGRLRVGWNKRLRTSAGRGWPGEALIELNPRIIGFGLEQVHQTLWHELAHLVAYERHGRKIEPHGVEWRQACCDLGIPNEDVRHDLPLPRRRQRRKYVYVCPKCFARYARVRRLDRESACLECCRAHAGGQYDPRFQLREIVL